MHAEKLFIRANRGSKKEDSMDETRKVIPRWFVISFLVAVVVVAPAAHAAGAKPHAAPRQPIGAPGATTTIDGRQLPPPSPKFGGVIKNNAVQSKPWWPPTVVPPQGAPNVLLILTDDVGFGAPSTFGGVIPTPALDRIAKAGLRYTQFHSTALCSPTRAALITGRNHHSSASARSPRCRPGSRATTASSAPRTRPSAGS
jgi:hypothetical protein